MTPFCRKPFLVAAVLMAFVAGISGAPQSYAADDGSSPTQGSSQTDSLPISKSQVGNIQYWGYSPDTGDWQSAVTTTTAGADHSPQVYLAKHPAVAASAKPAAVGAFTCSLYVPPVHRDGKRLVGETVAQCTGTYDGFYVGAQFKVKRYNGWQNFSGVMHSDMEYGAQQYWNWWRSCTSGSSYAYRLSAIQHTMDTGGGWHSGPSVYSDTDYHASCGT